MWMRLIYRELVLWLFQLCLKESRQEKPVNLTGMELIKKI